MGINKIVFSFFFSALSRAMHQFGKFIIKMLLTALKSVAAVVTVNKNTDEASESSVILHQVPKHLLTEIISTWLSTVFLLLVYFYLCKMLIHYINVSKLCRQAFYILRNSRY